MPLSYVAKRFGMFLLVVWAAATINFFLPRLGGQDPARAAILRQAALGGSNQSGLEEMVAEYDKKFGLDKPLWEQYLAYVGDMTRFDFNYSVASYPRTVVSMIGDGLPWTFGLLMTTIIISWLLGGLLGAFMAWPRSPKFLQFLMPPLLSLNAIPYFLLGLLLVYFFAFRLQWFPLSGGYTAGTFPGWNFSFVRNVVSHSVLPAFSIILVSIGGWALGMRAMMVTTHGEDYVTYADAKGLRGRTIFLRYLIRPSLLPQTTALALALGQLISGALLVEIIFTYPGIGTILFNAIRGSDYYLIQGIVFILIVSIGLATFILDLIYPLLDPRITYQRN
ncbi:MAG TPA: ABC transporter permease [Thermomicrobiales bacterium]